MMKLKDMKAGTFKGMSALDKKDLDIVMPQSFSHMAAFPAGMAN